MVTCQSAPKTKSAASRIIADIGFASRAGIARRQRVAAHHYDLIDPFGDARLEAQRQRDIGQRTHRNKRHFRRAERALARR